MKPKTVPLNKNNYTDLKTIKKDTLRIAKELCYPDEILERIRNAKEENELYRIMATARERGY